MKTKEYRFVDKSDWGDGPWMDEPDKIQFADEKTGLPCIIRRGPAGALCGYVGVTEGHPFFNVDYNADCRCDEPKDPDRTWHSCPESPEAKLEVHGGITYSDFCQETNNGEDETLICHVVEDGEDSKVWWFGFDCAHAFDLMPGMAARMKTIAPELVNTPYAEVYRDIDYVRNECADLARQLDELR